MSILGRLRRAARTVGRLASDAAEVSRDVGEAAAELAREAAAAAARDLAHRIERTPGPVRARAAEAIERAADRIDPVAPRAAAAVRRAAEPAPSPAPREPEPSKPEPAPEPAKPKKKRKPKQTKADAVKAAARPVPKPGEGKKAAQGRSLADRLGLAKVVRGAMAYANLEELEAVDEAENDFFGVREDLDAYCLREFPARAKLFSGHWQIAGQPRWARRWVALYLIYEWSEQDLRWVWRVGAQTALAVTADDARANAVDMIADGSYGRRDEDEEDEDAPNPPTIIVQIPVRPA